MAIARPPRQPPHHHHRTRDNAAPQAALDGNERARLVAIIDARQREIAALHRISELGLRPQPLAQILAAVVAEVSACTGFPIVAIEFYDAARQVMTFAAATGMPRPSDPAGLEIPVSQTLSGLVAQSGQALIETQAQDRPEYAAAPLRQLGVQTFVCVPMRVAAQMIGTLALAHPKLVPTDESLLTLAHSLANISATLITRKQAEAALEVALTKYQTLFDTFPLGITVADATGQIVESNRMAERLLGLGRAEQLQREIDGAAWQIVRPDGSPMPAEEYASVRALTEQRVIENVEMGVVTPRGATTWINVTAAPLPLDGAGVVITYHDITARRQAELALQQAMAELRRSNAELEQFAYVASHDLQEPLRMVTGMVQLLQQRYQDQIDARANQYIGLAVAEAARMHALITDLLAFSRLQQRVQPVAPTALETVLVDAQANLRVAIAESGAVITHDALPTVPADSVQLTQLLQNLLANAIKFRSIDPPHIHIGAERRDAAWCITVRDNGIGIAPEHFARIFVIFQRLHPSQAYPGTGIGLALCKKIVERHGGQIWVESCPGAGATFCFTIPDRRAP